MIHQDNLQCQFNPKSLKMLYVIHSENCFYRSGSLSRARQSHKRVSRRKFADFERWHRDWLEENATEEQRSATGEWLMGRAPGLAPNKTSKVVKSDQDAIPYRTYHKFKAEVVGTS